MAKTKKTPVDPVRQELLTRLLNIAPEPEQPQEVSFDEGDAGDVISPEPAEAPPAPDAERNPPEPPFFRLLHNYRQKTREMYDKGDGQYPGLSTDDILQMRKGVVPENPLVNHGNRRGREIADAGGPIMGKFPNVAELAMGAVPKGEPPPLDTSTPVKEPPDPHLIAALTAKTSTTTKPAAPQPVAQEDLAKLLLTPKAVVPAPAPAIQTPPSLPPIDRTGADQKLLASVLMRGAAGFSSAVAGDKPDYAPAQAVEQSAANDIATQEKDRNTYVGLLNATKQRAGVGGAQAVHDPTSQESRAAQAWLATNDPAAVVAIQKQTGLGLAELPANAIYKIAAADHTEVKDAQTQSNFDRSLAQRAQSQGNTQDRFVGTQLAKHIDKIRPLATMAQHLADVEAEYPGLVRGKAPAELNGANWNAELVASRLPHGVGSNLTKPEHQKLIQTVNAIHSEWGRIKAGQNFTEPEMRRIDRILGALPLNNDAALAIGLDVVRREIYALIKHSESGFSAVVHNPEVSSSRLHEYQTLAGNLPMTTGADLYSDLNAPAAPAGQKHVGGPAGAPTAPVPGRVRRKSDGLVKDVQDVNKYAQDPRFEVVK